MELDELLEREGHDGDDLLAWAQVRAEQLLAELVGQSDELARLLEPATQIDLDAVPVRRVSVAEDLVPAAPTTAAAAVPKLEIIEDAESTRPIDLPPVAHDGPHELDAAEAGTRGRRRVPSTPQPLSADELPPPPEHPRLAEGEPEPVMDTFDTGPIDLDTAEAQALIASNSTRIPLEPEVTAKAEAETETDAQSSEDSDDFEIDTLEELDDEELEIVEVEESEDEEESEAAAPPPPPPPPRRPPSEAAKAPAPPPPKSDNSVDIDGLLAELKGE